jgi:hypothetical protein
MVAQNLDEVAVKVRGHSAPIALTKVVPIRGLAVANPKSGHLEVVAYAAFHMSTVFCLYPGNFGCTFVAFCPVAYSSIVLI